MVSGIDKLLTAQTENEFFITMCSLLKSYRQPGINCYSELILGGEPGQPHLEVCLYMVLGRRLERGTGYNRRKVWTFTLDADGLLCWDAVHFQVDGPDTYTTSQLTRITGLAEIQRALQQATGPFVAGDLSDGFLSGLQTVAS